MSHSETQNPPRDTQTAALQRALQEQRERAVRDCDALRETISRELHDKFGQYLTVVELELAALARQDAMPARDRLEKLRALTAEAQRDMAAMAWQMRPVKLHGMDLETACQHLIAEWTGRSSITFDLQVTLGSQQLPRPVETTLYCVLQEAIVNAVKHANATRIGIIVQAVSGHAVLIVEDDGEGFSEQETGPGANSASSLSLGLTGIRERLALLDGELEIESLPGRGATLLVRVPL
jgi:signal transduction histidine kinase